MYEVPLLARPYLELPPRERYTKMREEYWQMRRESINTIGFGIPDQTSMASVEVQKLMSWLEAELAVIEEPSIEDQALEWLRSAMLWSPPQDRPLANPDIHISYRLYPTMKDLEEGPLREKVAEIVRDLRIKLPSEHQ